MLNIDRCTASPKDLDEGDCIPRCEKHMEMLVQAFELGDLWDTYGIVGDIILLIYVLFTEFSSVAIHERLSPSRHKRTIISRYPPPTHQRDVQGPLSWVDYQLYYQDKHEEGGRCNISRYW